MLLGKPSPGTGGQSVVEMDFPTDCCAIFDILVDLAEWQKLDGLPAPRRTDRGPLGVGSEWTMRFGPFRIWRQTWRLTSYDRPRRFSRSLRGSAVGDVDFVFEPTATGTRVTAKYQVLKLPWPFTRKIWLEAQQQGLARLRIALEHRK